MNSYGLSELHLNILRRVFDQHLNRGKVLIYGSRAKGTYRPESDIDLVIDCPYEDINRHTLANILDDLTESDLPYLCDLQYLANIKNPMLQEHIERIGQVIYEKET